MHAVERALGIENLYDQVSANLVHQLQAALRAKELYKKDRDYLVDKGSVKIVDEFTGGSSRVGAGPTGFTRRSKAKEGWPSRRRTRPWPRSPSRTTTGSTTVSPG